jgi:MoxR-like ATPase
MLNIWLDYPSEKEEIDIVKTTTSEYKPQLNKVLSAQDLVLFQDLVRYVPIADNVIEYAVKLVAKSRPKNPSAPDYVKKYVRYGAGPRASQYLVLGAKVRTLLNGNFTPSIEDIHALATSVLRHRIVMNFNAEAEGVSTVELIERLTKE